MKFGPVPLSEAEGKILGHNVAGADGRRVLRKGKPLTAADLELLHELGRTSVYVASLAPEDLDEDAAAGRVARAVMGRHLRLSGPVTGRANLYSRAAGVVRVAQAGLYALNNCDGITVATLPNQTTVDEGRVVATIKILPYGLPESTVEEAEAIAGENAPLLTLDPFPERTVGLILSGSPPARERIVRSFENALRPRLAALQATLSRVDFVPLEDEAHEEALVAAIQEQLAAGMEMIILAGETAIMDRDDMAPRAIRKAGGDITCFGAPVDPGNLLLLAYHGSTPLVGAPGCARSPKDNIVDLVLPRLIVGDRLTRADIVALGHGGLLEDVPERPLPRSRLQ
ncbi:MAG: molybdopterin-binding protein [Candidatus Promineifilaceae bacterium]|nr:molybdopterin-binding protein [Candidatus Promineifilaceae bacterium]